MMNPTFAITRYMKVKMDNGAVAVVVLDTRLLRLIENAFFYHYMRSDNDVYIEVRIGTLESMWVLNDAYLLEHMTYLEPFQERRVNAVKDWACFAVVNEGRVYFQIQRDSTIVNSLFSISQSDFSSLGTLPYFAVAPKPKRRVVYENN